MTTNFSYSFIKKIWRKKERGGKKRDRKGKGEEKEEKEKEKEGKRKRTIA